jgi:GNAT superfamily N-acetyltransferase
LSKRPATSSARAMAGRRGRRHLRLHFRNSASRRTPPGLWVAEHGDTIVGFGFSWMTEKFWFLSQLFVRPQTQAKGVGQALLSKTLMQAQRNGATNRALITPAYNITSTGLYLNNDLYPREPLYRIVLAAADALGVMGAKQALAEIGLAINLITGPCTDTPTLRERTQALCGIPAINLVRGPDQGAQSYLSGIAALE